MPVWRMLTQTTFNTHSHFYAFTDIPALKCYYFLSVGGLVVRCHSTALETQCLTHCRTFSKYLRRAHISKPIQYWTTCRVGSRRRNCRIRRSTAQCTPIVFSSIKFAFLQSRHLRSDLRAIAEQIGTKWENSLQSHIFDLMRCVLCRPSTSCYFVTILRATSRNNEQHSTQRSQTTISVQMYTFGKLYHRQIVFLTVCAQVQRRLRSALFVHRRHTKDGNVHVLSVSANVMNNWIVGVY